MEKFDQNDLTIDADKDKIVNELKIEIASLKKENKELNEKIDELKYSINKYYNGKTLEQELSHVHIIDAINCIYC